MTFEWVNIKDVTAAVINDYDSGDYVFNNFLREQAIEWQNMGEAVTYVFVDADERSSSTFTRIYGYVSK